MGWKLSTKKFFFSFSEEGVFISYKFSSSSCQKKKKKNSYLVPTILRPFGPYDPQSVPNILRPFCPYDPQSVPTILRPFGPYYLQSVPTILRPFCSTIRNRSLLPNIWLDFILLELTWVYSIMLG